MFPPVDQARRRMLTIAAGGAVAAVVRIPTSTSAEGINPSANKTNVLAPETAPEEITLPTTTPHPDAELLELGSEYERLWATEVPLEEESERLWNAADRRRYEKLGVDPDDKEACRAALDNRHSEWNAVREIADKEVGYNKAWRKWNRASLNTERVGKKILKIAPNSMAGLLVRIRVIETHDGVLDCEPAEQLLAEIRDFAKRAAANGAAA
jgi:hypothetical protein